LITLKKYNYDKNYWPMVAYHNGKELPAEHLRSQVQSPVGANFWSYVKKIPSLCLVHSWVTSSCASLSGLGAVAEWAVDVGRGGPLVMGGQGSEVFSTETYGSVTSYNDVSEGGFTLPGRVFMIKIIE
jgi:hypothetical protein